MNKIEFAFLKSHIKKAIYELETANKMKPNTIDTDTILYLKVILSSLVTNDFLEETHH